MNFSHAPRSSQPFDMSSATASVFGACRAASAARVEFYSFTLRSERLFGQAPSGANLTFESHLPRTLAQMSNSKAPLIYRVTSGPLIPTFAGERAGLTRSPLGGWSEEIQRNLICKSQDLI